MTSDSSSASASTVGTGGTSFSHRSSVPWSQVVRGGGEPEPKSASVSPSVTEQALRFSDQLTEPVTEAVAESMPEGSEGSNGDNESGVKKSVWNKPSVNGVVDGSSSPVMGAEKWPALSELGRLLPKTLSFQSESSSKSTSDGSVSISTQAPVTSQAQQKPGKSSTSHHSNQNHTHRQRSMKRGGSAGGGYNRLPPPPPPMPPYPLYTTPYGGFVPAVLDAPVREQTPYNGNSFVPTRTVAAIGSHSHPVHDHSYNRKRNNFGPRPRGDGGSYVNNGLGGRRDHIDREWFSPRSHGGVIPHHGVVPPPPPPPRGYMQPPHLGPAPFIAPQPIRPYGAPMVYEMPPPPPPPFVYVTPPIIPHASPSTNLPSLSDTILRQIEYYFSDANLVKDHYLRSNMDEEGWVPVTLIAGFHRVKSLTSNLQMVLSSIKDSTIVEVQGETVRRRNDWRKWIKPSINIASDFSSQSDDSIIETSLQKLSLDESTVTKERATDTELSGSIKPENMEVTSGDESLNPKSSTS